MTAMTAETTGLSLDNSDKVVTAADNRGFAGDGDAGGDDGLVLGGQRRGRDGGGRRRFSTVTAVAITSFSLDDGVEG